MTAGPQPAEEEGILVDEEDRPVGTAPRSEIRGRNLLHRGTAILCRDPAGRIFLHRRTDTKDVFPGLYDVFAGGMVSPGESYEESARRELSEELGIEGAELRLLFKHRYLGPENRLWTTVYEVIWDGPVRLQPEEIVSGEFVEEAELVERLDELPFVPDGLEVFRRYLAERAKAD